MCSLKSASPKPHLYTGKVIYRLCDIEAYENECLLLSTAELCKNAKLSDQSLTTALP